MIKKGSALSRVLISMAGLAIVVGACTGAATPAPSAEAMTYTIGFSNPGGVGNGWREAMICSAKAEAAKSGMVTEVTVLHRDTDATGQLEDIRNLIAKGVDAIIINPADGSALDAAIAEADAAGIVVVSVDAPVTAPSAYNLSNNQEEYAYLGAKWLFENLGGSGAVVYMRGIAGHPADTDRDTGFKRALAEFPGISVAKETATKWDPATGVAQINDIITSGVKFDGIWTSGIDSSIVDAVKTAGIPFVPIVGADNAGFVTQLLNESGLVGAAVTNPPAVGGAGVALALKILSGNAPADHKVLVSPEIWNNADEAGRATLTAAADPSIDPLWPLGLTVPGWTNYSKAEIIACKGPGE